MGGADVSESVCRDAERLGELVAGAAWSAALAPSPGTIGVLSRASRWSEDLSPETSLPPTQKPYKINLADLSWQPYGRDRFSSEHRFVDLHLRQRKIGLIVSRLAPGTVSCPFHFHHVSEELFYIQEGTGTLRYGGEKTDVGPGDIVSCPPGPDGAHQFLARGSSPLVYMAFSTEDHETEVCEYPDSDKVAIVGRGPDLRPVFRAIYRRADRTRSAQPELPGPDLSRPYKVNAEELPWQTFGDPGMEDRIPLVRSRRLDLAITRLAPGGTPNDFHFHHASEEMFCILEGCGTLRYGPDTVPVRPGDVIACPPGPDGAHQLLDTSDGPLVYLAVSTEVFGAEVCEYLDTGMVRAWVPLPGGGFGQYAFFGSFPKAETVDHYEGEI